MSAPIGNDYRHNSLDGSFVEGPTIFFFRFCKKITSTNIFLRLMINSQQLYSRQFKGVERPTCYHYEGRQQGGPKLKVMTKIPQFMCSEHLNCQIISMYCRHPKLPSSTMFRPELFCWPVQHIVSRIRGHLSVSHCHGHRAFLHLLLFCCLLYESLVIIIFKLSRFGSC